MTVHSMTGFGRARGELSERFAASVVVRSVNHRYLDVQVRTNLREEMPEMEAAVRTEVARRLERGRVTVQLSLERLQPAAARVLVDRGAVASALSQLRALEVDQEVASPVELRDILGLPGLVTVSLDEAAVQDAEIDAAVQLAAAACEGLEDMRQAEGAELTTHLSAELAAIEGFVDWFEPQVPAIRAALVDRLRQRLDETTRDRAGVEPERVLQEAAVQSERADVSEEVVRLRSHVQQARARLAGGGSVGRQLDFLCQEILRELNTLGSKCREVGVAERLIDAKTASERLREQVQNLE